MVAQKNRREFAELLISYGADVNAKGNVSTLPIPKSDISPSHYNNCCATVPSRYSMSSVQYDFGSYTL